MKTALQIKRTGSRPNAATLPPFTPALVGLRRATASVCAFALLLGVVAWPGRVLGQSSSLMTSGAFTYQGHLQFKERPANGPFDFIFQLYTGAEGPETVCNPVTLEAVPVSKGVFTVLIDTDCGGKGAFDGRARWLQLWVRETSARTGYTLLNPRQLVTPAPYATYAVRAGQSEWGGLTGIPRDFADGRDNDTTYEAGPGLELRGGTFALAEEGIGAAHLMPFAVNRHKIANNAVSAEKIDDGAVIGAKIGAGVIEESHLGPAFLTTLRTKYWRTSGNGGTLAGVHFLGTTDNKPLDLRVNNQRALRLEPHPSGPNHIAGASDNGVGAGVYGATIGGGVYNRIEQESHYATIAGGLGNLVSDFGLGYAHRTFIGGGESNVIASAGGATIAGGSQNHVGENASFAFIGGGHRNDVVMDAGYAVIAGGQQNEIGSSTAGNSIGGGLGNVIDDNVDFGRIAGGRGNLLINGGSYGAISGGRSNSIGGFASYGFIGGGQENLIGDWAEHAVVGGGLDNVVETDAIYATIPGGRQNTAASYGFAAGRRARALHTGAFVWGDSTDANVASSANNQFTVRASGGIRLFTSPGLTAGVAVSAGGTGWSVISDREAKENIHPVDAGKVLDLVCALPIARWNMKTQDSSIQHMGPMAQDFHAAFGLGEDERRINTVDADGVALAAIQGLNHKLELMARDTRIAALEAQVGRLQSQFEALYRLLQPAND